MFWNKKEEVKQEEAPKKYYNMVLSADSDKEIYWRLVEMFRTKPYVKRGCDYYSVGFTSIHKQCYVFTDESPRIEVCVKNKSAWGWSYMDERVDIAINRLNNSIEAQTAIVSDSLANLSFVQYVSLKEEKDKLLDMIEQKEKQKEEAKKAKDRADCIALMDEVLS